LNVESKPTHPEVELSGCSIVGSQPMPSGSPMPSSPQATIGIAVHGDRTAAVALSRLDHNLLRTLAERWAKKNETVAANLYDVVKSKAIEIAGPQPSGLVLSFAVTAAVAWFELSIRSHRLDFDRELCPDVSDVCYQRAFRRWMTAVRTLSIAQRHKLSAVQINMAHQQQVVFRPE
jgi:hypothetical protein